MSQTPETTEEIRTIRSANLLQGCEEMLLFIVHLCFVSGIRTFHYRFPGIISRHGRLIKLKQLIKNASDLENSVASLRRDSDNNILQLLRGSQQAVPGQGRRGGRRR